MLALRYEASSPASYLLTIKPTCSSARSSAFDLASSKILMANHFAILEAQYPCIPDFTPNSQDFVNCSLGWRWRVEFIVCKGSPKIDERCNCYGHIHCQ